MSNKRSLKLLYPALLLALMLLLAMACERRPLYVMLDENVTVRIEVDWKINYKALYDDEPNGMSVMAWKDGIGTPIIKATNGQSVELSLTPGTYYLAIFNELMEDYSPKLQFLDIDNYDQMTVRANTYRGTRWGEDELFMYSPDDPRICVALDTIEITKDMLTRDTTIFIPYNDFINSDSIRKRESTYVYEVTEITWPMTVDLFIKARVKHRQSIKSIDGSISGLANGFYFSHINRTSESGTLRFYPEMFENLKIGEDADSMGLITIKVPCFGLPHGKELLEQRRPEDNVLTFDITLVNDSIHHESFNVGKYVRYIYPSGEEAQVRYREDLRNLLLEIDLSETIVVPPVEVPISTGFDAEVADWEDGGTIDIGL